MEVDELFGGGVLGWFLYFLFVFHFLMTYIITVDLVHEAFLKASLENVDASGLRELRRAHQEPKENPLSDFSGVGKVSKTLCSFTLSS